MVKLACDADDWIWYTLGVCDAASAATLVDAARGTALMGALAAAVGLRRLYVPIPAAEPTTTRAAQPATNERRNREGCVLFMGPSFCGLAWNSLRGRTVL